MFKRCCALAALAMATLLAAPVWASGDRVHITNLGSCTAGRPWDVYVIGADSDKDCDPAAPNGTSEAHCRCLNGTIAAVTSGTGSAGDSFKTIDLPSGTDPVADSSTDTLAVTCTAPLTCTGNSGTDTWAMAWTSTPLVSADIDTSSELRAILGDESGTGALLFGFTTTATDDLSCSGSQVVRRNSGDTAFECATLSTGLTHDQVMARVSYGGW